MPNAMPALPNLRQVDDQLYSAGQPGPEQLRQLAAAGVRTVVNLCGAGECDWDEAAVVEENGMRYVHLPVCGPEDVCVERAKALDKVLAEPGNYPLVVHCGSGNRVGALFALRARACRGCSPEEALEAGKQAGLTGLEPHVRACLEGGRA